jgi:hypothetical protein
MLTKLTERHSMEPKKVVKSSNRPDMIGRPQGTLFSDTGSSGWGRRWIVTKPQGVSEHDFHHHHGKFTEPEEDDD